MTSSTHTTLTEVLEAAISSRLGDTYHMLPGIVQTYYAATYEADVQIAINDPRFDPDTDQLTTEPWPVWPKMRVAWPRFGTQTLVGALAHGDHVQVFFQDLDDSAYRTTGQQSDPPRTRRFGSDSAFCVPWNLTDAGAGAKVDMLALSKTIDAVFKILSTWTPVPNDGGAALKTALNAGPLMGFTTVASNVEVDQ